MNRDVDMQNSDTEIPVNPFRDAKVKSKFFGPTEAGQKFLDEHPELAEEGRNYAPQTFIPFAANRNLDDLLEDFDPDPAFSLADYLDFSRPIDYFALYDAWSCACEAGCGLQFGSTIKKLGEFQAAFWDCMVGAHHSRVIEGKEKPPAGFLQDANGENTPAREQPTQASPFWWEEI